MHLLDTYATSTGSTINEPYIYTSFFPVPNEPYITFQAQTKNDAKDYSYWQDVINIVFPVLQRLGINIVQVGQQHEQQYQFTMDFRGKTNINQLAYVIQNAKLHFGADSLGTHLAAGFDVPLVSIYSNSQKNVSGPKFGNPEKQILFESYLRVGNKKPSYAANEFPKSINTIKPEEIAHAIFKLLGLDFTLPFETVYIGERYGIGKINELIPTIPVRTSNPEVPIEVRMDVEFNETVLAQQLSLGKVIVFTDKPINLDILNRFKSNLVSLVYEVKENDNPEFIVKARKLGLPCVLISYLSEEVVRPKTINYYEYGRINIFKRMGADSVEELRKDLDNLYYRSNKIIMDNKKFYLSNAARINGIEVTNELDYQKVIDSPEFWNEIGFMHIIKKVK